MLAPDEEELELEDEELLDDELEDEDDELLEEELDEDDDPPEDELKLFCEMGTH